MRINPDEGSEKSRRLCDPRSSNTTRRATIAETTNDISVATVTATSESSPQPPRAMAETAFWATHFWSTWWLLPILTRVVVPSARAGTYCIADILLVLLAHACGERARLRETLRDFAPFAGALMAL